MVASCHIRKYMKSNKRRKRVKALSSTLKREVVRVNTYKLECFPYLVLLILIVGYMYNMLLFTDVYYFFSMLMARLWWPCYDTLVYDLTLSSRDVTDRSYKWWSFVALRTEGKSVRIFKCATFLMLLSLHLVSCHLNCLRFGFEACPSCWCNSFSAAKV